MLVRLAEADQRRNPVAHEFERCSAELASTRAARRLASLDQRLEGRGRHAVAVGPGDDGGLPGVLPERRQAFAQESEVQGVDLAAELLDQRRPLQKGVVAVVVEDARERGAADQELRALKIPAELLL